MRIFWLSFFLAHLVLLMYGIIHVPIHWDEGWNLCVARTWFEDHHFGCKIMGQLTTPRLATGWIPIALTKLSFHITGVSYIGGRIVNALGLILLLFGIYRFTYVAYKKSTMAMLAVFLSICISPDARLNLILLSNQGYSEIYAAGFLIWGFTFIAYLQKDQAQSNVKDILLVLLTSLFFALSIKTKYLIFPFLLTGLSFSAILSIATKNLRTAVIAISTAVCTYVLYSNIQFFYPIGAAQITTVGSGTAGLQSVLGINFNLDMKIRLISYMSTWYWIHGLLLILLMRSMITKKFWFNDNIQIANIALGSTLFAWSAWFFSLSVDFPRYYSIPSALASPFIAKLVMDLFYQLSPKPSEHKTSLSIFNELSLVKKIGILSVTSYFIIQLILTPIVVSQFMNNHSSYNKEVIDVAQFLNDNLRHNEFVETYETPLFFFLKANYHYPPDQLNVDSIAKHTGRMNFTTYYDWKSLKPTCLVRGEWSQQVFHLYAEEEYIEEYTMIQPHEDELLQIFCRKDWIKNMNRIKIDS